MSDINVDRGCGRRKKGGFYLETKMGKGGTLNAVTYCFGSHIDETGGAPANNLVADIPARGVWLGHFPASFLMGEWLPIGNAVTIGDGETAVYEQLKHQLISPYCIGDKVSKSYYSCASFISEAVEHGPSRKIPKTIAQKVGALLPIPILFFFDLPLFHSATQRDAMLEICGIEIDGLEFNALWHNPDYGLSIDFSNSGQSHYMTQLIGQLDAPEAKAFMVAEGIQTAVFPGCICWLNQVRYILTDEDEPEEMAREMMQYGIEIVNLKTHKD